MYKAVASAHARHGAGQRRHRRCARSRLVRVRQPWITTWATALYLDCLQFMLALFLQGGNPFTDGDPSRAAHVLNNSWGCPPIEGC